MNFQIGKYLSILVTLVLILCQPLTAQNKSLFKKINPAVFDTVAFQPDAFAIGDVNGDGFEDLVMSQSSTKPIIFYYFNHPDSALGKGFWDFNSIHGLTQENEGLPRDTVPYSVPAIGPIHVVDTDGNGKNELYFHFNAYTSTARGFYYADNLPEGEQIANFSIPSGYSWTYNSVMAWTFLDYNKDGLLDGIQGLQETKNAINFLISNIYRQNNQNVVRITDSDIQTVYSRTVGLYAFDFNNDSWTDVLEINALYPNFTALQDNFYGGSETGLTLRGDTQLGGFTSVSGAAIGDYNNDGLLDVYLLSAGSAKRNIFYKNKGNFQFESLSNTATLDQLDSRSASWGDFNNDGLLDLVIAEYNGSAGTGAYPTLLQNLGPDANGVYTFKKRNINSLPELNSIGKWNHVSFIDINKDGDLDILLTGKQSFQPIILFENELIQSDTIAANEKRWIGFDLINTNSFNKISIGAKLKLTASINGKTVHQYKELQPFHGLLEQHSKFIHFGLKNATSATLEISWPSGTSQTLQFNSLDDLNTYHTITEPPAAKMVIKTAQPYSMTANLEESLRDTIRIENIGSGSLNLTKVELNKPYYQIESFSNTIAPNSTGYIALSLSTTNSAYLGSYNDTLLISSNALSGKTKFVLKTSIKSRPAHFSLIEVSSKAPFLDSFDTFTYSYVGDFNNDGFSDILIQRKDSLLQLYQQSEDGMYTIEPNHIINQLGKKTKMVAVGDLNHDGFDDFVLANESQTNQIVLSNASEYALFPIDAFNEIKVTKHIVLHDINRDGSLDILVANSSNQTNQIILNQKGSSFSSVSMLNDEFSKSLSYSGYMKVIDWDKDGLDDIFVTEVNNPAGNKIIYYRQVEELIFKKTTLAGVTDRTFTAKGIHFFDMENDGDFDILLVSALSSTASILLRNDNSTLTPVLKTTFDSIKGTTGDVTMLDFNLDGYVDILFTNEDFSGSNMLLQSILGTNYLILNTGDMLESTGKSTLGASQIDWNSDAIPDLLISNYFGSIELYQNDLAEYNWVGIIPTSVYKSNNKTTIRTGTEVILKTTLNGVEQTMSRIIGEQSLFSKNYNAAWFGLGNATSAEIEINIPGSDITFTSTLTELNTYVPLDVVGVTNERSTQIPDNFEVKHAFPNPFNPSTNITFTIPNAGLVSVSVVDILGREVFSNQLFLSAGMHSQQINLSAFSSGVYLIKCQYQNQMQYQKVTLIK
ncbi:T9SS type A sorting domain-containing protein [bacterium]|nr:MAG: T9SS type A sorting domain-containing protein [bacterium]